MDSQRRPRQVAEEALVPSLCPGGSLDFGAAAGAVHQQPGELHEDVSAPAPYAEESKLAHRGGLEVDGLLAAQEGQVLKDLEEYQGDDLSEGEDRLERSRRILDDSHRAVLFGFDLFRAHPRDDPLKTKIQPQQTPEAVNGPRLAQHSRERLEVIRQAQRKRRPGRCWSRGQHHRRGGRQLEGHGDELLGGLAERVAAERLEHGAGQLEEVAEELQHGVGAGAGLDASQQVGGEGVGVGGHGGEHGADGGLGGRRDGGRRVDGGGNFGRGRDVDGGVDCYVRHGDGDGDEKMEETMIELKLELELAIDSSWLVESRDYRSARSIAKRWRKKLRWPDEQRRDATCINRLRNN